MVEWIFGGFCQNTRWFDADFVWSASVSVYRHPQKAVHSTRNVRRTHKRTDKRTEFGKHSHFNADVEWHPELGTDRCRAVWCTLLIHQTSPGGSNQTLKTKRKQLERQTRRTLQSGDINNERRSPGPNLDKCRLFGDSLNQEFYRRLPCRPYRRLVVRFSKFDCKCDCQSGDWQKRVKKIPRPSKKCSLSVKQRERERESFCFSWAPYLSGVRNGLKVARSRLDSIKKALW